MNTASQTLHQIVAAHGVGISSAPTICQTLLASRRTHPNETRALVQAIRLGIVRELWDRPDAPPMPFVQRLVSTGRLDRPAAYWAVTTWAAIIRLAAGERPPRNWNAVSRGSGTVTDLRRQWRAVTVSWVAVAAVAAFAAIVPVLLLAIGYDRLTPTVLDWLNRYRVARVGTPLEFALAYASMAGVGGMLGGGVGYVPFGLQRFMPGPLIGALAGTAAGAADGALLGIAWGGLAGALLGAFVGGCVGAFVGERVGWPTLLWPAARLLLR